MTILQWIFIGIYSHKNKLKYLDNKYSCSILALQETHLKPNQYFSLNNFTSYHRDYYGGMTARVGVVIVIHETLPHCEIVLTTPLQAEKRLLSPISLCSLSLTPGHYSTLEESIDLVNQLPRLNSSIQIPISIFHLNFYKHQYELHTMEY